MKIRKHDIATATDLSRIDNLTLDQQGNELYAEMMDLVAMKMFSAYGEAVRDLRLAAINERFERIAQARLDGAA